MSLLWGYYMSLLGGVEHAFSFRFWNGLLRQEKYGALLELESSHESRWKSTVLRSMYETNETRGGWKLIDTHEVAISTTCTQWWRNDFNYDAQNFPRRFPRKCSMRKGKCYSSRSGSHLAVSTEWVLPQTNETCLCKSSSPFTMGFYSCLYDCNM